jgi:peptidoglycan/LPS O-acetylase OafA/YrhL
MLLLFGTPNAVSLGRLIANAAFVDNFAGWINGYGPIPYALHLWTLAYEFQIYLLIPLAFILYVAMGKRMMMFALAIAWLICMAARGAFVLIGAPHPIIWMTPFLRPESTLLGIALSIGLASRLSSVMLLAMLLVSGAASVLLPNVWIIGWSTMLLYPAVAIFAGSLAGLAMRGRLSALLSWWPIVFLGKISFGLYVYHLLAIGLAQSALPTDMPWGVEFVAALGLTVFLAGASYYFLELPFLRLKRRFTVIENRPI